MDKNEKQEDSKLEKVFDALTGWINPYSKAQRCGAVILAVCIAAAEHYYIRSSAKKKKEREKGS
jgi:hypothetical protein